jgi:hypothetical protein
MTGNVDCRMSNLDCLNAADLSRKDAKRLYVPSRLVPEFSRKDAKLAKKPFVLGDTPSKSPRREPELNHVLNADTEVAYKSLEASKLFLSFASLRENPIAQLVRSKTQDITHKTQDTNTTAQRITQ